MSGVYVFWFHPLGRPQTFLRLYHSWQVVAALLRTPKQLAPWAGFNELFALSRSVA